MNKYRNRNLGGKIYYIFFFDLHMKLWVLLTSETLQVLFTTLYLTIPPLQNNFLPDHLQLLCINKIRTFKRQKSV